jgi:hypothetical protein
MFESDADREAMLRALGGVSFAAPLGLFVGLLDRDYVGVGDVPVESEAIRITARSSDVERLRVSEGSALVADSGTYIVRGVQPDGLGMTVLVVEGP